MRRLFSVLLMSLVLLALCSCSDQNAEFSNGSDDLQNLNTETTSSDLTESVSDQTETVDENKSQTFTKDFDGVILTVTTDKSTYAVGEPIALTATLENKSDKDIYLLYGFIPFEESVELMPRFEDLIQYPIYGGLGRDEAVREILFTRGEKCVQDFTFQTYTGDYVPAVSEDGQHILIPDYNKPAKPGVHSGKLYVQTGTEKNYPYGVETNYSLEFSVTII